MIPQHPHPTRPHSDSSQYAGRVIDLAVPGDAAQGAAGGAFAFLTARRGAPEGLQSPLDAAGAAAGAGTGVGGKKELGDLVFNLAADGSVKVSV